ncbi:hypothetical protein [Pseudomonas sp. TH15]|uniref:hypothetical protein n=1 Tax=Pseudomonas sp. TH15 TaxID=2796381 RepID=UPI001F5B6D25|nr:hypothetical protein [Pseudomonas sp. TH15]
MTWYKSGTVSVAQNSNAVIGVGTAFIANSRVGDAWIGPDSGLYEVTNIASDTALSISPPYRGPTVVGGTYALAPMQGYLKNTADALRQASLEVGDALDGLEESVLSASTSAASALASKNAAALSETSAGSSAATAVASKDAAALSAGSALASKNAAAVSETNAGVSAAAALASKNAAATSETNAAASAATSAFLGVGRGYIDGLVLEFVSLTSIKIKAGSAFVPALNRTVTLAADKTISPALSASAFHHAYLYENAGAGDIEISSTALPTAYFGSANQKTGDASRRYIGSFLTANNAAIWKFHHESRRNFVRYIENLTTAPFLVLTGTAATTPTPASCAAVVPRTGHTALASVYAGTGLYFSSSDSPSALSNTSWGVGYSTGPTTQYDLYLSRGTGVEQQFRYFGLAAAAVFTLVHGYYFDR